MKTTRSAEVVIKLTLEIDTDLMGIENVPEDPEDENEITDVVEEAIAYAVQEVDYSFNIDQPGITIIRSNLESYNI